MRVGHDCASATLIADVYGHRFSKRSRECVGIYRCCKGVYCCNVCGQLWKILFVCDNAIQDCSAFWLLPGKIHPRQPNLSFPGDEAVIVARILNADTIAELPEGLVSDISYIRRFAEKRAEELVSKAE